MRWLDGIIDLMDMFELGDSDGQGRLACGSLWSRRVRLSFLLCHEKEAASAVRGQGGYTFLMLQEYTGGLEFFLKKEARIFNPLEDCGRPLISFSRP